VNRCPSCHNLVPAGWIACRRCGAALTAGRPSPFVDKALPRRSALPGGATTATLTRTAPPAITPTRDTLLPGTQTDTLISATARSRSRKRKHTRVVASGVGAGVVIVVAWFVVASVTGGTSKASDARVRAEKLIRRAAVAATPLFAPEKSFTAVTPLSLARASGLSVVPANTPAAQGALSMRAVNDSRLILATSASTTTCVFGRDDSGRVTFAFTTGRPCRADASPRYGWGSDS